MILQETIERITELYGKELKHIAVERIAIGIFFTGVKLTSGNGGISYTPTAEIHQGACCTVPLSSRQKFFGFKDMTAHEVLLSPDNTPLFNTVKIVVLNALSAPFLTHSRYTLVEDCDVLDIVDFDPTKKICMVGAFAPFLKKFKKVDGIHLRVIEKKKGNLRKDEMRYFVPAEDAWEVIPECDVAIITGSAVANGTMDELLNYVRPETMTIVVGPTASFLPDAFFRSNVDIVSGVSVIKPDKTLDMLVEGAGAYHLFDTCMKKINIIGSQSCYGDSR